MVATDIILLTWQCQNDESKVILDLSFCVRQGENAPIQTPHT